MAQTALNVAALALHWGRPEGWRRRPAGDWYCFEANPSPAFTFYEDATGQPIGRSIAALLAAATLIRATR